MKKQRSDFSDLIEKYFYTEGAYWDEDKYITLSPLREDKNNQGGFIIWKSGSWHDSILDEGKGKHFSDLLIMSKKAKDKKQTTEIIRGKKLKTTIYKYVDENNNDVFEVRRYDYEYGKTFAQYCKTKTEKRPLYLLPELIKHKGPIIIVEGEKCVEIANKYFKEKNVNYFATTWIGGAQGISKADFSFVKNKELYFWPDNDIAGNTTIDKIKIISPGIKIINVSALKKGEDIADVIERNEKIAPFLKNCNEQQTEINYNTRMPVEKWFQDHIDIHKKRVSVTATLENFKILMEHYNIKIKENIMTHDIEIRTMNLKKEGKINNAALGIIKSLCVLNEFATGNIDQYITTIASENQYHPVKEEIEKITWDGKSRLQEVYDLLKVDQSFPDDLVKLYVRKWLISCIAALYSEPFSFMCRGTLVLQGPQYIGKTRFFMSLFDPSWFREGLLLDPRNKDRVEEAISYWVCELGEIEGTFKKADIASLKAFLTMKKDVIRFAYERRKEEYPRRTVFCATVNDQEFLTDQTGGSRFWVIPVEDVKEDHDVNIMQLWAEVKELYIKSEKWWLTVEENKILEINAREFTILDVILEQIKEVFAVDEESVQVLTTTQIAQRIGYSNKNNYEIQKLSQTLKRVRIFKPGWNENRNKGWYVPPLRDVKSKIVNMEDYKDAAEF